MPVPPVTPVDGLLLVDKAAGMSSHAVVSRARRALGTRAVGHAGTLDPMATGLLVLGVGEGTKLLHHIVADDKYYEAVVQLGVATDSLDADGQIVGHAPVPVDLSPDAVRGAAAGLMGVTQQRAPTVSAIKRDGEPLYRKVRRGEAVEAPLREVTLHALQVDAAEGDSVVLRVHCGKGYYVRALARDLAARLGTVGHLTMLRRTRSGIHDVRDAIPTALLQAAATAPALRAQVRAKVIPPGEAATALMPGLRVDDAGVVHLRHGRPASLQHALAGAPLPAMPADPVALLDAEGQLVAVGRVADGHMHVRRGFAPRAALPV